MPASNKVKEKPIAYTIKDKAFGKFDVKNSANAWWLDKKKVQDLISAYKMDCTDEEAIANAGITLGQLRYFKEEHKEFLHVKEVCKQMPFLKARKTIVDNLDKPSEAQWYMTRKKKAEFSERQELTGEDGGPILHREVSQKEADRIKQLLSDEVKE